MKWVAFIFATVLIIVWLYVLIKDILSLGIGSSRKERIYNRNISFFETIRLTGMPIISFENNKKWINMLLDTGSTNSIIDTNKLPELEYENIEGGKSNVFGLDGKSRSGGCVILPFQYKHDVYSIECMSMDMSSTFNRMKQEHGIVIHGILGTDFLEKYKYVLDFNEMVAYFNIHKK